MLLYFESVYLKARQANDELMKTEREKNNACMNQGEWQTAKT